MKAYDKKTFMGKLFFNPTDNQELRLSYTANRSDDILYPSSKMDALYDDSDIYNLEYSITDMGSLSKKLDFQAYHSEVDHPMSNKYRRSAVMGTEMISALTTDMDGLKLKNLMELGEADLTVGVDASRRNWDGKYINVTTGTTLPIKSIDDVDTDNIAVFTKLEQSFGKLDLDAGLRYDDTSIEHSGALKDNDYSSLNGYVFTTYNADAGRQFFVGAGKSTRVPDARELYFTSQMPMPTGTLIGTPTLEQTTNYEIDLGLRKQYSNGYSKIKVFHSWLKDFIAYNATNMNFENVDAKIYGIEVSGSYTISEAAYVDAGLAYQRGKKDAPLSGGQTDRDLAEIPPLKANVALNYDTEMTSSKIEVIAADNWSSFDSDNGEQAISGYAIANIEWNRDLTNGFDITLGMDNVFDHTYAVSNTYQDLTLLVTGVPGDEIMLLNEPGRYIYANLRYRF
jgi:iron complex outermembrane receptor protein